MLLGGGTGQPEVGGAKQSFVGTSGMHELDTPVMVLGRGTGQPEVGGAKRGCMATAGRVWF